MDLNGDGNQDILSGSYSRMSQPMAGLLQVLWGQDDGGFNAAEELQGTDGEPLIIPAGETDEQNGGVSLENICTRPMAVDWDCDGDLDLVVGNFGGSFYVFSGEGEGRFSPSAQPILSGGEPIKIQGHHSDPFVVDWDGDGDLDLLSGSSTGGVQWSENTAGAGRAPELAAFQTLIPANAAIEYGKLLSESELTGPTTSTRIWVDDVNGDGKLDILVGDSTTLISPADGVTEEEYAEKYAAWQEELQKATQEYTAAMTETDVTEEEEHAEEEEAEPSGLGEWLGSLFGGGKKSKREQPQAKINKLYQQQAQFMRSDMTGFVWLYLQQ